MALEALVLDARLQTIASYVPECECAADIGADHGKLSAWLLLNNRCKRMIVSDISMASLQRAQELLTAYHVESCAEFRCADGLSAIDRPIQTAIISGMGGKTIEKILSRHSVLGEARLIISAQTLLEELRKFLNSIGYRILYENIVDCKRHFYSVMVAERGGETLTARDFFLGKNLVFSDSNTREKYYRWRMKHSLAVQDCFRDQRISWLKEAYEDEPSNCPNDLPVA